MRKNPIVLLCFSIFLLVFMALGFFLLSSSSSEKATLIQSSVTFNILNPIELSEFIDIASEARSTSEVPRKLMSTVDSLRGQLSHLEEQRESLAIAFGPQNPKRIKIENQIKRLNEELRSTANRYPALAKETADTTSTRELAKILRISLHDYSLNPKTKRLISVTITNKPAKILAIRWVTDNGLHPATNTFSLKTKAQQDIVKMAQVVSRSNLDYEFIHFIGEFPASSFTSSQDRMAIRVIFNKSVIQREVPQPIDKTYLDPSFDILKFADRLWMHTDLNMEYR